MRLPALSTLHAALNLERDRLTLWVPVLLATGIGLYFAAPVEPSPWLAVGGVAACISMLRMLWRRVGLRLAALVLLLMAFGFTVAMIRTHMVAAPVLHKTLFFREVEGRIDDIKVKPKGETLLLSQLAIEGVQARTTPARLTVSLKKPGNALEIGDRVSLKAMLFPPPTPTMPRAYDFARGFYFDRIGAVGFSPYAPEVLEHAAAGNFELWLNDVRLKLAERIRAPMGEENGAVAAALMVGEDAQVSDAVKDAMRDSGIYHVLSISGLHMSLAVGLLYFTVRLLLSLYMPLALRLPVKKIAAFVGLSGALAYLLLAGYPVPAVRSFIMVACVMLAVMLDRRGISLYSLAWAAVLILLIEPESLLGASFQLSFAATMAIIALYEQFSPSLSAPNQSVPRLIVKYFIGLMATSLAATFATTPLVIYHFNRFSVWGIIANMLMVPLASFWIMPAAVLAFLAMPLGLEAWPLAALESGIALMIDGARWFAAMPYASIPLPSPTFWGFLLIVYGGLWLCLWRQRWRWLGAPAVVIGLMTLLLHKPYDLWVSDDATKVMARLETGEYLLVRGTMRSFDVESWLKAEGEEAALTLRDRPEAMACSEFYCLWKNVAIARKKDEAKSICNAPADILISSDWLAGACDKPLLFDKKFLTLNGAAGLRFTPEGAAVESASQFRGKRPWVTVPHYALYGRKEPDRMPEKGSDDDH